VLLEHDTVARASHPALRGVNDLETQKLATAWRGRGEDVGSVQASLVVSDDQVVLIASEDEGRVRRPVGEHGVPGKVVRRHHDTGVAPPEDGQLVAQVLKRLRVDGRVALPRSRRVDTPVRG